MKIGIALLGYSRPKHLNKVIDAIIKENIKELTLYMDGPENNLVKQKQKKIILSISKYKKIKINLVQQKKNGGLAFSVTNAISSELKKNEAVILLEDDCVPQTGFFNYMFNSLKKYKNNKNVRSICSFSNIKENFLKKKEAVFLKRFNPWGWGTWRKEWSEYEKDIKKIVKDIINTGKSDTLPLDLKSYCHNSNILSGEQDIWSLSWTLLHYKNSNLVLYPPISLIQNIGFDGSGIHCVKTNAFRVNSSQSFRKISLPKLIKLNFSREIEFSNFLVENSFKTFFKKKELDLVEPYSFVRKSKFVTFDKVKYFVEKFTNFTKLLDIHTHLYPSKEKKFFKSGIIELLNYHYLISEFLSSTKYNPKKFYKLSNFKKANLIWENLILKKLPISTSTLGVVKVLQNYDIINCKLPLKKLLNEFNKLKITEKDVFDLSGIKKVVMTNNPFEKQEFNVLKSNQDNRYIPSIRIDDLFVKKEECLKFMNSHNFNNKDELKNIYQYFKFLINKYKPAYFALSTENFVEFEKNKLFETILKVLRENNLSLMLLAGVKRSVNPDYKLAGDGIGDLNLNKFEQILRTHKNNKFLITCLNLSDQYKLTVLSRKFQNFKIFGFWWFNNQPRIVENLLEMRFDLLGDNFLPQHSDARILDQLIYKWSDFRKSYVEVLTKKYEKLICSGYSIEVKDIEKNIFNHLYQNPKEIIGL